MAGPDAGGVGAAGRGLGQLGGDGPPRSVAPPPYGFIDVASTATDLIPIEGGKIRARGATDPGRLARDELVDTGASRTNVSAVVEGVPVRGRWCRIAAELLRMPRPADAPRACSVLTVNVCGALSGAGA